MISIVLGSDDISYMIIYDRRYDCKVLKKLGNSLL